MSVPAGLMQALQQGGAGGGPAGGPGGPAPSIQIGGAGPSDGPDSPDVEALLQEAKAALQKAEDAESDHIDSQTILKCITAIQGILASRQKGAESALGVTPAHKAMSRSY
jgi:hypothetical protein